MLSDFAIEIERVSKRYLVYDRPIDRLKQMIFPRIRRLFGLGNKSYFREFPAVEDVSILVERGQTIGVVGRNGSGKSTLLQMICGTLQPSSGSIRIKGRIAALLELGSGFNPEFTGRENVFLNAAILGLTKQETEERFDQIAAFADIGEFMDQPVKSYSSGMYVRLAFAVATNVEPDILIVDEALAVGDEAFQRKCFARIEQVKERGGTILFVSHSAQVIIQLCDYAVLMDGGEMILRGSPKKVIHQYQRMMNLTGEPAETVREEIKALNGEVTSPDEGDPEDAPVEIKTDTKLEQAWLDKALISKSRVDFDSKGACIAAVRIVDEHGNHVNRLILSRTYFFTYKVTFLEPATHTAMAMFIKTLQGVELAGLASHPPGIGLTAQLGEEYTVTFPFKCLFLPGTYACNCGVYVSGGGEWKQLHRILDAVIFKVEPTDTSNIRMGIVDAFPEESAVQIIRQPVIEIA